MLSVHAPMAPPHLQAHPASSEPHGCCPRSHRGFSSKSPRAVSIKGYHPNYFLLMFRPTPSYSHLQKIVNTTMGPPRGLQGPFRGFQGLVQNPPPFYKEAASVGDGKSVYIAKVWPTGLAGGRAVPPDVWEEPGGALYVHSP